MFNPHCKPLDMKKNNFMYRDNGIINNQYIPESLPLLNKYRSINYEYFLNDNDDLNVDMN